MSNQRILVIDGGYNNGMVTGLTGEHVKIGKLRYKLLSIGDIPLCYYSEQLRPETIMRWMFEEYGGRGYGAVCFGGPLDSKRFEHSRPIIYARELPKSSFCYDIMEPVVHKEVQYHHEVLCINTTDYPLYLLEGLTTNDLVDLLVKGWIRERN